MRYSFLPSALKHVARKTFFSFRGWQPHIEQHPFLSVISYKGKHAPTIILAGTLRAELRHLPHCMKGCNLVHLRPTRKNIFVPGAVTLASAIPGSIFVASSEKYISALEASFPKSLKVSLLLRNPLYLQRGMGMDGFVIASPDRKKLPGTSDLVTEDDLSNFHALDLPSGNRRCATPHIIVGSFLDGQTSEAAKIQIELLPDLDIIKSRSPAQIAFMDNPFRTDIRPFSHASIARIGFSDFFRARQNVHALYGFDDSVELLGRMFGIKSVRMGTAHEEKQKTLHFFLTPVFRSFDRQVLSGQDKIALAAPALGNARDFVARAFPEDETLLALCAAYDSSRTHDTGDRDIRSGLIDALLAKKDAKTMSVSNCQKICSLLVEDIMRSGDLDNGMRMVGTLPRNWFSLKAQLDLFNNLAQRFDAGLDKTHYSALRKSDLSPKELLQLAAKLSVLEHHVGACDLVGKRNWSILRPSDQMVSVIRSFTQTSKNARKPLQPHMRMLEALSHREEKWQKAWRLNPDAMNFALKANERGKEKLVKVMSLVAERQHDARPLTRTQYGLIETVAKNPDLSTTLLDPILNILVTRSRTASALKLLRMRFKEDPKAVRTYAVKRIVGILLNRGNFRVAEKLLRWGHAQGLASCGTLLNSLLITYGLAEQDMEKTTARIKKASPDEILRLSELLNAVGRRPDAVSLIREAINGGQLDRSASVLPLARMLRADNQYNTALAWLETLNPHDLTAEQAVEYSLTLLAAGRPHEAVDILDIPLQSHSSNLSLLLHAVKVLRRIDKHERAVVICEYVLAKNPLHPAILRRWGNSVVRSGQADSKIAHLEALSNRPGSEIYHLAHIASILAAKGRLFDAAMLAYKATKKQPANVHLHAFSTELLSQIDDRKRLAELTLLQDKAQATSAHTLRRQAESHVVKNDREAARKAAQQAVNLAPSDSASYFVKGRIEFDLGDLDAAERDFRAALHHDPSYFHAASQLARVKLQKGETDQAKNTIDLAVALSKLGFKNADPQIMAIKGEIDDHEGEFAKARHSYEVVNEINAIQGNDPNMRIAWSAGLTAAASGDFEGQARNTALIAEAIHRTLPAKIKVWNGEEIEGKHVVLAMRGGPGDELRTTQAVLPFLIEQKCKLTIIADKRLHAVYRHNFPDIDLVTNPKAGRRLATQGKPIDAEFSNNLAPSTYEVWSRFGMYLPADTMEKCDYLIVSDDLWQKAYFSRAHELKEAAWQKTLAVPASGSSIIQTYLDETAPAFRVAISWRGGYFSANRPSTAFMNVDEMGPLFALEGVDYIDVHPNKFDEEYALIRAKYPDARLHRPEQFDLMSDFEMLGSLFQNVDASILPGITQRDVAGAFGANHILSFGLKTGAHETWRIDPDSKCDRLQNSIRHFSLNDYGSREAVVEALANEIITLRDAARS